VSEARANLSKFGDCLTKFDQLQSYSIILNHKVHSRDILIAVF